MAHAAGEVDRSFKGSLLKTGTGQVYRSVIQSDGKIIITGDFNVAVTEGRTNIARLNADGTLDTTFSPPAIVGSAPAIRAIVLQADGKIVIGGYFSRGVRRLNPDGSDDTAFNNNPWFDNQTRVEALDILPDGRIIYAGDRSSPFRNNLTVLSSDGSVISDDSTFNVLRLAVQPDGKIITFDSGPTIMRRLHPDLSIDTDFTQVAFGGSSSVESIIFQPDGKIVAGGDFSTVNGGSLSGLARINTNGTVDTTFNIPATAGVFPSSLAYLSDGKILAGGTGLLGGSIIVRLNANGTRDTSFVAPTGFTAVNDLDIQIDGRIFVSCQTNNVVNVPSPIIRLNAGGSLDTTFSGPVGKSGFGLHVRVLPDNKILVGGDFNFAGGLPRAYLARFNADGTIDPTFNQTTISTFPNDFEVYPDGKVVVGTFGTIRLNTDGTRDTSWNDTVGTTYDVLPLSDGRTLVSRSNGAIQRLTSSGNVDTTFSTTNLNGRAYRIQLQSDGRILVGGDFTNVNGTSRNNIARLNADGGLDTSFNLLGGTNGQINDIDLQSDGKIVVAGRFTSIGFVVRTGMARLNSADGSLDTGFAPVLNSYVESVKILTDGRFVIGGSFTHVDGQLRVGYARLLSDGGLDGGFTGPGSNGAALSLDTQSDGTLIMAGNFSLVNGISAPGMVRVLNGASVNKAFCDYDGDGRSDISVFRPSNGAWYLQRSHAGFYGMLWGLPTDKITPGDYDGDGKTDVAVYRPSNGVWYVFNSGNGTVSYSVFGIAEDLPTPADYDGDGETDISLFRPSTGTWYRQNSSNGTFFGVKFGISTDKPTLGDFDGDGKADIAVFRSSTGTWYRINSSNGTSVFERFGDNTDIPVAADYDADGKTDLAVFHPSNGNWIFKRSSVSDVVTYPFGISTDIPAPADFDGDGKADPSVFRQSTGNWYRANSANSSISGLRFGINGDKPTMTAFRY